jgi:hypothetical protein
MREMMNNLASTKKIIDETKVVHIVINVFPNHYRTNDFHDTKTLDCFYLSAFRHVIKFVENLITCLDGVKRKESFHC